MVAKANPMTDRKKPGAAFWATVAMVVVMIYVASIGPVCWISSRANAAGPTVSIVYRPLTWGMSGDVRIADAVSWYSELGSAKGWTWVDAKRWTHVEPMGIGRWLNSPRARAISRNLGVDDE